jgi:ferredoxin
MTKKIKPVIEPGCIACGSCQFIAPEVFEVTDKSRVKQDIDYSKYAEKIKEAAAKCPVNVIKIGEEK